MPLSDSQIERLAIDHNMISPYAKGESRAGVISYGVTSYGYDVRIRNEFRVIDQNASMTSRGDAKSPHALCIDPKNPQEGLWRQVVTPKLLLPPHGFALCETVERIKVPRDIHVICVGKSTYARCGLIVNVTPLEPEWEGTITIELHNTTTLPICVYAEEGIAQLIFLRADEVCQVSYADKKGKYQEQAGITHAYVESGV